MLLAALELHSVSKGSMLRLGRLCAHLREADARPCAAVSEERRAAAFAQYCEEGRERAMALGNRGPIRFGTDGKLAPEILESYYANGFYVLEQAIGSDELSELQRELEELLDNAPVARGETVDAHGRPVRWPEVYNMAAPLSDPLGGTSKIGMWDWKKDQPYKDKHGREGRNHIQMHEPPPPPDAPALVVATITRPLAVSEAALRISAHPNLLRVGEALSGPDMTPFVRRSSLSC